MAFHYGHGIGYHATPARQDREIISGSDRDWVMAGSASPGDSGSPLNVRKALEGGDIVAGAAPAP